MSRMLETRPKSMSTSSPNSSGCRHHASITRRATNPAWTVPTALLRNAARLAAGRAATRAAKGHWWMLAAQKALREVKKVKLVAEMAREEIREEGGASMVGGWVGGVVLCLGVCALA